METFGFLIHPMDLNDVVKKYKIASKINPKVVASVLKRRRPFVISEITGIRSITGDRAHGWLIVVPFLPDQFFDLEQDYVIEKIVKACEVGRKEGAGIIGLGAFTAIPGDGGKVVSEWSRVPVTTGNTYTVVAAIDGTKEAAARMDIDLKSATLAVVGATGSIGSACAEVLASQVQNLILIGRDIEKLDNVAQRVKGANKQTKASTDVSDVRDADVIITVTGAVDAIISPKDIKSGAVVCDVARPRDVSEMVMNKRNDVLVIDGGIVKVPGNLNYHIDMGLSKGEALGCMAETMMLALEKRYESYTIGKEISIEKVNEAAGFAKKHGFMLAGLRSFEKKISSSNINRVKTNARANEATV